METCAGCGVSLCRINCLWWRCGSDARRLQHLCIWSYFNRRQNRCLCFNLKGSQYAILIAPDGKSYWRRRGSDSLGMRSCWLEVVLLQSLSVLNSRSGIPERYLLSSFIKIRFATVLSRLVGSSCTMFRSHQVRPSSCRWQESRGPLPCPSPC